MIGHRHIEPHLDTNPAWKNHEKAILSIEPVETSDRLISKASSLSTGYGNVHVQPIGSCAYAVHANFNDAAMVNTRENAQKK